MITPSIDVPSWLFYDAGPSVFRFTIDDILAVYRSFKVVTLTMIRAHNKSLLLFLKDSIGLFMPDSLMGQLVWQENNLDRILLDLLAGCVRVHFLN
jgi:hypothetical protein